MLRSGLMRQRDNCMKQYIFGLSALLFSCGGDPNDPIAKLTYEAALEAKGSGDQVTYIAKLKVLADKYEDSMYGRRAKNILNSPVFKEGGQNNEAKALQDFRQKIRADGVRETLKQIFEAEKLYFSSPRTGVFDEPLPARFVSAGPTPTEVPKGRAEIPSAPGFDEAGWRALKFSQSGPMRYQYSVLTQGEGPNAQMIIRAMGDLDSDGIFSIYELNAKANGASVVQVGEIRVKEEGE
jgi:hypothetical protein